jgi:hypothetical protein
MPNIFKSLTPIFAVIATWATIVFAADTTTVASSSVNGFDPTNIVDTAIKSLGPLAILGWYLWYDKSKSQPRRDRETREERETAARLYEARIDKIIDAQNKQTEASSMAIKTQAEAFASTANRMADVHEKMIENCSRNSGCKVS